MANITETNRKHFDGLQPRDDFGELINMVIAELRSARGWISPMLANSTPSTAPAAREEVRLLDYACGAGTVSKALAPYATQTIGLDLSANMVSEYNKAAREMFGKHGPRTARMEGFQHDLLQIPNSGASDSVPDPGAAGLRSGAEVGDNTLPSGTLAPFDIIVIGMALHHVADAGRLLQRFAGLLKPGGVCIVLDMLPGSAILGEDGDEEGSDLREGLEQGEERGVFDTIAKHGFTETEMRDLYEGAGMVKFDYMVFEQRFRFMLFGQQCSSRGFIARGERM
ncbi:hypothetical protein BDW72DRAFT_215082 [Aspergillus terricola var. indicus]